jgi:hypothetical protein
MVASSLIATMLPLCFHVQFLPTFSVDTKSAVSNKVNWLIWSTIVAILGFASPDAHLRCILCCVAPMVGRTYAAGLAVQMHRLKARNAGAAIVM